MPSTVLWYRTYVLPVSTRLCYKMAPDIPQFEASYGTKRIALLATAQKDSLNPVAFPRHGNDLAVDAGECLKTERFLASPTLPLKIFISAGIYKMARGTTGQKGILDGSRNLCDTLRAKGYQMTYREYASGHDYIAWKEHLADGLIALFSNTITVNHSAGTTHLAKSPMQVVTLGLDALGMLNKLEIKPIGIVKQRLPRHLNKYDSDHYQTIGTLLDPDFEKIKALKPDIIIANNRTLKHYDKLSAIAPTVVHEANSQNY